VYDHAGNVASYGTLACKPPAYVYNPLGRLSQVTHSSSTVSYTYDAGIGPLTITDSASGQLSNSYDAFGTSPPKAGRTAPSPRPMTQLTGGSR
jgi:hypothetical protein